MPQLFLCQGGALTAQSGQRSVPAQYSPIPSSLTLPHPGVGESSDHQGGLRDVPRALCLTPACGARTCFILDSQLKLPLTALFGYIIEAQKFYLSIALGMDVLGMFPAVLQMMPQ